MTEPKFKCQGSSVALTTKGESIRRDFGFWRIYGGWFQGVGGGMYGQGGIAVTIPGTCSAIADYRTSCASYEEGGTWYTPLIADGTTEGEAGLIYTKTGTIDLSVNSRAKLSVSSLSTEGTGYGGDRMDYTFFLAKMGVYDKTPWDGEGAPTYSPGSNDFQIFTHTGDITFDFSPGAGQKLIFLIKGNVTVPANIDVPITAGSPSFLAVIASGTVTFTNAVDYAEGWWVGNSLTVESTGSTATDKQFVGEGSFIGWDSISLQRDRGFTNNSQPSEKFIFRPDLMVNAPGPMTSAYHIWRQERP